MLKETVKYKDFLGNDREKTLYFMITETAAIRMISRELQIGEDAPEVARQGFVKRLRDTVDSGDGGAIMALFDEFVEASYGELSEDGETFKQSKELYDAWTQTASYHHFFKELMEDTDKMIDFVRGIFPANWGAEELAQDPEFQRHREALEKLSKEGPEHPTV